MKKLILALFTYMFMISSTYAADKSIIFCKKLDIKQEFIQSMRIDNGDDFSIIQQSKYSYQIISHTNSIKSTKIMIHNGSNKKEITLVNDCEKNKVVSNLDIN